MVPVYRASSSQGTGVRFISLADASANPLPLSCSSIGGASSAREAAGDRARSAGAAAMACANAATSWALRPVFLDRSRHARERFTRKRVFSLLMVQSGPAARSFSSAAPAFFLFLLTSLSALFLASKTFAFAFSAASSSGSSSAPMRKLVMLAKKPPVMRLLARDTHRRLLFRRSAATRRAPLSSVSAFSARLSVVSFTFGPSAGMMAAMKESEKALPLSEAYCRPLLLSPRSSDSAFCIGAVVSSVRRKSRYCSFSA
mmetsp:Transcript_3846/g.8677  ORF Transcript_3846/g.8677 Transcript_3846/m.8677 type:complete len:258 (+) Transcript_3846:29-802(+)